MKRALLSVVTAFCLMLFISANALNFFYPQQSDSISFLEQLDDSSEENEKSGNETKSSEEEQDEVVTSYIEIVPVSYIQTCRLIKATSFNLSENYYMEISSPPPQC